MILFLKNALFTVLIPGTVAVVVPLFVFERQAIGELAFEIAGGILIIVGAVIYAWTVWDFATSGRGTPLPLDPPRSLVVRGLYRFTRNPMYLGVLSVIAGWALAFKSPALAIYAAVVATCFHLFVLLYEEPHLKSTFGASYEQYCRDVGRWLPFRRQRAAM